MKVGAKRCRVRRSVKKDKELQEKCKARICALILTRFCQLTLVFAVVKSIGRTS